MKRAALAVLWASYNVQESGLSVASSLGEAAGLEGRHQWGLILPSSARVSLVTYQTVIAVRYPDLVHIDSGEVSYGMFFSADPGQAGGFLPIVWDVPGTDMEAADAIKVVTSYLLEKFEFGTEAADSLTVLHNRTNMVRVFGNSVTISVRGGDAFLLNSTPEIRILSLEHFFDAFRAAPMRDLRSEVISAFHLSPDKVTDDLVISRQTATELIRPDVRDLDVVDEPDQDENSPLRQPIRTPRDVRDQDTDVAMSQSSWTSSEDTSAEDSCTDEEHDQELFLEAYTAFTTKSDEVGSVDSLRRWFSSVERLPDSWPLARLSITLDGLTSQLSKVVMSATMEIIASCRYPDYGLPSVTQLAKDVTVALALHLADLVANWLCGIVDQQAVLLFNESTACMLQASYWVRPIYEELLYSSSHAYQGSTVEAQRASNGLVKVISSKTGSEGDHVPQTSSSCISPLVVLGKSLSASVLQIWFPCSLGCSCGDPA